MHLPAHSWWHCRGRFTIRLCPEDLLVQGGNGRQGCGLHGWSAGSLGPLGWLVLAGRHLPALPWHPTFHTIKICLHAWSRRSLDTFIEGADTKTHLGPAGPVRRGSINRGICHSSGVQADWVAGHDSCARTVTSTVCTVPGKAPVCFVLGHACLQQSRSSGTPGPSSTGMFMLCLAIRHEVDDSISVQPVQLHAIRGCASLPTWLP